MNLISGIAVFIGAGLGALVRWGLGHWLNASFPLLPLGTLAANVLGGLLMGLVLGALTQFEAMAPAARLALTVGFLGGLTTFSAFSGESAALLLRGEFRWAVLHTFAHVGATLLATFAGIACAQWVLRQ